MGGLIMIFVLGLIAGALLTLMFIDMNNGRW